MEIYMESNIPEWTLGYKLKKYRLAQGKTLKEVADAIEVSPQFISAVEKGRSGISLSKYRRLLSYYNASVEENLFKPEPEGDLIHLEEAEPFSAGVDGIYAYFLFKKEWTKQLEPLYYRMTPGTEMGKKQHEGSEFLFIMEGAIDCIVEDPVTKSSQTYHMVKGDTLHLRSMLIHKLVCSGPQIAEVLAVASPRKFTILHQE